MHGILAQLLMTGCRSGSDPCSTCGQVNKFLSGSDWGMLYVGGIQIDSASCLLIGSGLCSYELFVRVVSVCVRFGFPFRSARR